MDLTVQASTSTTTSDRGTAAPYARSWLDVLFDAMSALPGPTWLAYLGVTFVSVIVANAAPWLAGLRPWGDPDPTQVFWGLATAALLGAAHYLRNVAGHAFDDFAPALGEVGLDPARERFELTTMPARAVLILTVFSFLVTPVYYLTDPVAAQVVGLSGIAFVPRIISEGGTSAIVLAVLYQAIRQMRRVSRLHAMARNVDPFQPAPLYAFSRLTSQVAIVLIAFNTAGILANTSALSSASFFALYLPWLAAFIGGSIIIFVVPLRGMHRRLETVKDGMESASGGRLRTLLGELDAAVDARDPARVDALDKMVGAVRREREAIRVLPTWPWSTGTLRTFASALFLPVVLFLIQRFLSQVLA